ncbi:MAG TPA: TolC family protein [Candidatus Binatia bacterium]|nr:TolC family protein [Candidatus Binatia bacterium]
MVKATGTTRPRAASKLMWLTAVLAASLLGTGAGFAQTGGATPPDTTGLDGEGPAQSVSPSAPAGDRWSLARAVAAALEGNVDARAAHAQTVRARGSALSAWSGILPSFSGNLSYNRSKQSSILFEGVTPSPFVDHRGSQGGGLEAQTNLLSVPAWSEKKRQGLLRHGAEESEAEARNGVVFAVKQQYFTLVKAERLAQVSRESERLARDEETRAEALFEVGTVARGDVLKARARRATTQLDRISAVNQVEIQRSKLKQVIGLKPGASLTIDTALDENVVVPDSAAAVAAALKERPDLSRAAAAERAARAGLFGARAKRLPSITGSASFDRSKNTDHLEGQSEIEFNSTEWLGQVRLSLPIFDGFALEGGMKAAKGTLLEAEAQRRQREVDVAVEVQQAWLLVREAVERIDVSKEGLASAQEDYNFSKGRYDLGAGTFLDLLTAEVSLTQAKQSYVEAVADAHVAEASLERAVGARRY